MAFRNATTNSKSKWKLVTEYPVTDYQCGAIRALPMWRIEEKTIL